MDDKRSYDVTHPESGIGFLRTQSQQRRITGVGDSALWGVKTVSSRRAEDIWAEELADLLPTLDPDEMEPIRGKAMKNLFGKRDRSHGIYNTPVVKSTMPSEVPTFIVVRETKTTARVFNTMTGRPSSKVVPISKACKIARQQNGERE